MSLPTLSGTARLIDDPELRFSANGVAVCKVRLAFNSRRKNESTGQWEDADSYFVDGTVFKQEAENVAESLVRGQEVVVTGRLKTRKYETREGEKRSVTDLVIDSIGPSLKFATARVQKMDRSGGSQGGSPRANTADAPDPWATPAQPGGSQYDDAPF